MVLLNKTVWKQEKWYFEAIFGWISKFDLIFDSVGVPSSKGDNKGACLWQILRACNKKGKIMVFRSFF